MARLSNTVFILCALISSLASAQTETRASIAVPNIQARGVDESLAKSLTDLVVRELDRSQIFRVVSMDEILQMIQHDQLKTAMGCDDASCLAEIGGALGVDMLVTGSIGKIGDAHILSLKLIDVKNIEVIKREERTIKGKVEDLINETRMATRVLVRPLLEEASGFLRLGCSEEGAEVYVDEILMGTTPLKKRKVSGGYHKMQVKKSGFIAFAKDVKIEAHKVMTLDIRLMPSPEFVKAYESKATTFRALAWGGLGLGALSLLSTGAVLGVNLAFLDAFNKAKDAGESIAQLQDRRLLINNMATGSLVLGLVAAVTGPTGAVFWILGDEPGKYARILEEQGLEEQESKEQGAE